MPWDEPSRNRSKKMHSVIEFSELERVIDQAFKTYSSGMQARLMFFSTAISIEPEILIIDEALAVGDSLFQRKCFDKFSEFRASEKTILLVSHNEEIVNSLCTGAILLDKGEIISQGDAFIGHQTHTTNYYSQANKTETRKMKSIYRFRQT